VSARTGAGIPELLAKLQELLEHTPSKPDLGRPRLPIDRVFSLTGFGTVVTGTLLDGSLSVGDEVVSLPEGLSARIRGLQNHNQKLQKISPGSRAAVNLVGIEKSQLSRGSVITKPGAYTPTTLLDIHFRYLADLPFDLKHNTQVKIYIGAAEAAGQARLLGKELLKPGEQAFLQIRLASPVVAARGDRLIIRLPSPAETLGGGVVLEAHPTRLHKRFSEPVLQNLEGLLSGGESEFLLQALKALRAANADAVIAKAGLDQQTGLALLDTLIGEGSVVLLQTAKDPSREFVIEAGTWQQVRGELLRVLAGFHASSPLKPGMPREALRAACKLPAQLFDAALENLRANQEVQLRGALTALASHRIAFTTDQQAQIALLLQRFHESPYSPPDSAETAAFIGSPLLEALVATGELVQVSPQIVFSPQAYAEMSAWVKAHIEERGSLTLAEFRDHFGTSRKYAAALLEYLDNCGITLRKGDIRVLKQVQ
jgi:selenocysteine-specific elongation factor